MFKYVGFTRVETGDTVLEFRGGDETVKVNYFTGVDVVSIESDVEADMDALISSQSQDINCTVITLDEFKVAVDSTPQVQRVRQRVKESYDKEMEVITGKYPQNERETWKIQLEEANKYLASSDVADAPFLKILADAEGATVDDFAAAVIAKNNDFVVLSANVLAKKRADEKSMFAAIGLV